MLVIPGLHLDHEVDISGWIAMNRHSWSPHDESYLDFGDPLTFIASEVSQRLVDGLPHNIV